MSEYAVEKRETAPKNFFAGDFPTVPETGVAGAETKSFRLLQQKKRTQSEFLRQQQERANQSHII